MIDVTSKWRNSNSNMHQLKEKQQVPSAATQTKTAARPTIATTKIVVTTIIRI